MAQKRVLRSNYLGDITLELTPSREMDRVIIAGGVWELEILNLIDELVHSGDSVVDVGASSGFISIPLAKRVGNLGRVSAFEPDPVSLVFLYRNIALNPLLAPSITVYECGLSDQQGAQFIYHADQSGNAYISGARNPKFGHTDVEEPVECQMRRLDDCLGNGALHFLKIDAEGMENLVLRGALETLRRHRPIVVFETITASFGESYARECEELLRMLGYRVFMLVSPLGLLLPSTFPTFTETTVAIPEERARDTPQLLMNALKLEVSAGPLSHREIWLASLDFHEPFLSTRAGLMRDWRVEVNGDELKIRSTPFTYTLAIPRLFPRGEVVATVEGSAESTYATVRYEGTLLYV